MTLSAAGSMPDKRASAAGPGSPATARSAIVRTWNKRRPVKTSYSTTPSE